MKTLSIDIETYSSNPLAKCGVYKYAEADDFVVTLFGYSADGGAARVIDLASGEVIPAEILDALVDPNVVKWAHNAAFERVCLSRHLRDLGRLDAGGFIRPEGWRCSMVWCAYLGLPLSLAQAGEALGLENQKMAEGAALVRYFCQPQWRGGLPERNLPERALDKWETFKAYCLRDVEVEVAIQARLAKFPPPDALWGEYWLDQTINDRGVALDLELAREAIVINARAKEVIAERIREQTMIANPNSVAQVKAWLAANGLELDSLETEATDEALKTAPTHIGEILRLRRQLAKSSVSKYQAMEAVACADGRARGMFFFYGARTGRWAGRLIQLQNLPRNKMPLSELELARDRVGSGDMDAMRAIYVSIPDVLSELVRTAFIPSEGRKLIVADYSAIEARVLAWLAGETWRNEVFATHGKIYEASASRMFRVPIEEVTKGSPLRQKGKVAELALGYGGSAGALRAMGALDMGLDEGELMPLVDAWRQANPAIVNLWRDVDMAVRDAVGRRKTTLLDKGLAISCESGMLFIRLPSGRRLAYAKPRIEANAFGADCVTYDGLVGPKWGRAESYGPKFVENITQAISRDLLAFSLANLSAAGFEVVMHIHDEAVIDAEQSVSVSAVTEVMSHAPAWAAGLTLRADGYECDYYRKD